MRPVLHPKLVNGPFDDPGLYISFLFEKKAFLFDIGDIHKLTSKELLKISHIFVSHTHMDHFIGFDHLLRLFLGRNKTLFFYGPEGFLQNLEGKLAGYSWNLVNRYNHPLTLRATEVHPDRTFSKIYPCASSFKASTQAVCRPFSGTLLKTPGLSVRSVVLDHRLACLGFCVEENFHVNILKDRVEALGLSVGPWLKQFKETLYSKTPPESIFSFYQNNLRYQFKIGDLADQISQMTAGQKICYITDVRFSPENEEKMVSLARNADHLFIEAAFLEKDKAIAGEKYHLTAHEAGTIARKANVKQFTIFHHSPRYASMQYLLENEAQKAFDGSIV